MANTANAGIHIGDDRTTAAQALDRLLLGAGVFWKFAPAGGLDVYPIDIGTPVVSLRAENIQRQKIFPPHKKRRLGWKQNNRQHSDSEISAALLETNAKVLTINEKIRWLAGQYADFEGRYSFLRARAVALSLSTTTLDNARANWIATLGQYSPAWNDTTQDTVIYSPWWTEGFPTNWATSGTGSLSGPTSAGWITLTDSDAVNHRIWQRSQARSAGVFQYSVAIPVKKQVSSTTSCMFRLYSTGSTADRMLDVHMDPALGTANARTIVQLGNPLIGVDDGGWVFDLGDSWLMVCTVTMPSDATTVNVQIYPAVGAASPLGYDGAKTGSIEIREPVIAIGNTPPLGRYLLLARLNEYSAQLTALNKAVSEVDGLTSIVVTGAPTITIQRDSGGVVKTGQLPALSNYTAKGGNTDYTSLGTWTKTVLSGSLTASVPTAGQISIDTFTTPGKVNLNFSYGPISRDFPIDVKAQDDPPTSGGGGGGGGSGTTVSTTTLTDTTGTSYDLTTGTASKSAKLTVQTGATGRIDLTAPIAFRRVLTALGSTGAAGKFRWRVVGGSYADVATEQTSSADSDKIAGDPVEDGYLSVTMAKTGLSANTNYEIEFDWRQTNTSGTASTITRVSGVIQAVGS